MDRLLRMLLRRAILRGSLRITTASGARLILGDATGTPVAIRFTNRAAEWGVLTDPDLKFGEAYVDGGLIVEQGTIMDVLAIILSQPREAKLPYGAHLRRLVRYLRRRLRQFNSRQNSRHNVAHHYDLDGGLYRLFLDADRQYSCAYFDSAGQVLDDAQLAKKRHLASKLFMKPNQRVLDLGCGWGGLALYLSEVCNARITGITLSTKQLAFARARAEELDLAKQARFRSQDYPRLVGTV